MSLGSWIPTYAGMTKHVPSKPVPEQAGSEDKLSTCLRQVKRGRQACHSRVGGNL